VTLNHSKKLDIVTVKVVVTGPFAAGKTTLISTISEIPVLETETSVSTDAEAGTKDHTTVTMDFGKLTVADEDMLAELYLFGTPGQDRFDFMWDVLAEGMDGYILMIDLSREEGVKEACRILGHFREMSDAPFVIGANKAASNPDALSTLTDALSVDPDTTIVPCEATQRESAKTLLLELLLKVLATLADDAEVPVG
jgi:uncharacterized protein